MNKRSLKIKSPTLKSVDLFAESIDRVKHLIHRSRQMAQLLNQLSSIQFNKFYDHSSWDNKNGTPAYPDPSRNALKLQKFYGLAAGGMLNSCATMLTPHLNPKAYSDGIYSGYTPLSSSAVARAGLEYASYSNFILEESTPELKSLRAKSMVINGLQSYGWEDKRSFFGGEFFKNIKNWNYPSNVKVPKFNASNESAKVSTLFERPYDVLSNAAHGNPTLIATSIIDAQEHLGINLQHDFWNVSILYDACVTLGNKFIDYTDDTESEINLRKEVSFISNLETWTSLPWGTPKRIPDRDLE